MNRKFYFILKTLFYIAISTYFCSCAQPLKFAIASDFHAPDVPNGKERVASFIRAAQDENIDFIIELGDFCRLDSASREYRELWNSFEGDKYHVIGNHDMDKYNAEEYVAGMGMPGRYYSFDKGDFHFIVLDGNNLYDGEKYSMTYDEPLYAIVTLTKKGASVKGKKANFVPPTPQDLHMGDSIDSFPLVSDIEDAEIRF